MNLSLDDVLQRVVSRAADLVSLPAIATTDWCDRAAEAIGSSVPGFRGLIAVFVADVNAAGAVRRVESQSVRLISPIDPDRPTPPMILLSEANHNIERLNNIGWDATGSAPLAGLLGLVARTEHWSAMPVVQALGGSRVSQPFVASASLGGTRAIIAVMAPIAGSQPFDSAALASLRALFPLVVQRARVAFGDAVDSGATISDREQLVLNHLVLGKSVRQIADELGRSPHTVHDHVKSLHRKLNASSRGELIARALGYVSRATRIRDAHRTAGHSPDQN